MIRRLVFFDYSVSLLVTILASVMALFGSAVHFQRDRSFGERYGFIDLTPGGFAIRFARETPAPPPTPGVIEPILDIKERT